MKKEAVRLKTKKVHQRLKPTAVNHKQKNEKRSWELKNTKNLSKPKPECLKP